MFGFLHSLPQQEQVSLVEMARRERVAQRRIDQQDELELDAFRVARRKSNSQLELESLVKNFALALSFYDRYVQRGIRVAAEIQPALEGLTITQLRLDWLREQIEMRVIGLRWVEFKSHWSSSGDEHVGTVDDLTQQLRDILVDEAERPIPKAAAAPIMQRKTFRSLGTPTAQAHLLSDQRLSLSSADMLEAATRERERLEAIGELDTVGDQQPADPPPLDASLVGHQLEIHRRYWRPTQPGERGKKKQVVYLHPHH